MNPHLSRILIHFLSLLNLFFFSAFIDNEVQNVCETIDDYQISIDRDLPQDLWDTFKKEGFMGMIIPKTYGGKGFSAHGHSQVVQKISSCSSNVSGTIAVPNSLGPGKSMKSVHNVFFFSLQRTFFALSVFYEKYFFIFAAFITIYITKLKFHEHKRKNYFTTRKKFIIKLPQI